jgi:hypothetical protein
MARRLHIAAVSHERTENGFPDVGGLRGTLRASKPTFLGRSLPVRRPAPWRLALNLNECSDPDSLFKFDSTIAES